MKNITLAVFLAFILVSCGAKKSEIKRSEESLKTVDIDKSKIDKSEEVKKISESNINRTIETKVDDQNETTTVKETIEPVDNSKKAVYKDKDGQLQELNNTKKTTETTTKKNNTKTELLEKLEEFKKNDSTAVIKESVENDITAKTDKKEAVRDDTKNRKPWSLWNLLWLLIPIILSVYIRGQYIKYKNNLP